MVHVIPLLPCRHSETKIRRTVNGVCRSPVNVIKQTNRIRQNSPSIVTHLVFVLVNHL